jgi:hypothetical protein
MRNIQSTLYPERSFVCDLVAARNSLNHLALRRAPALQEETDKRRDCAEQSSADEENRNTLVKVLHGEKGDSRHHDRNSTDGDGV